MMNRTLRELAKFGAGVAAWESVVHLSFALSRVLPMKLTGVTISPTLNRVQIFVPALASALMAYYAWHHRQGGAGLPTCLAAGASGDDSMRST
jgi:hypothetical protein